jgi:hypothetical protein
MQESFDIPVLYQNKELLIPGRLLVQGYTYKIAVTLDENTILFEPDEERNFRAVLDPDINDSKIKRPEVPLLQAIAEALTLLLK